MDWIYPLGLLGLLGLVILLIIYILKPNYQLKAVSSTFVWKLSLQYKRRKIPVSKLRNVLIIICQILIISICAFGITRPFLADFVEPPKDQRIMILDASASMLAGQGGDETRFERAVSQIKTLGRSTIEEGKLVTVILAGTKADPILLSAAKIEDLDKAMDKLVEKTEDLGLPVACTFGQADIDGAMLLAEGYLAENPLSDVYLYTATLYEDVGNVNVVDVSKRDVKIYEENTEWNAAILDVKVTYEEHSYRFAVDVISYNADRNIPVTLAAYGVNGAAEDTLFVPLGDANCDAVAFCAENKLDVVRFNNLGIYSYHSIHIFIDADDSFAWDNHYYLYGGVKEELKVIYVSPFASDFYTGVLASLPLALASRWDVYCTMTSFFDLGEQNIKELKGYDLYIFEYQMPETLPTDGAVLLTVGGIDGMDGKAPMDSGLSFGVSVDNNLIHPDFLKLYPGEPSQFMSSVNPRNIEVRQHRRIVYGADYTPLMYHKMNPEQPETWDPMFLVKNTRDSKVAVLSFTSYYSDLSVSVEFATILFNLMNCFFPPTLSRYVYNIGDQLVFDQSDAVLEETKPIITVTPFGGENQYYTSFPYNITAMTPNTYTMTQRLVSDTAVKERYYFRVAASESDFTKVLKFEMPLIPPPPSIDYDIYIFLAAVVCALILAERLLARREY
ncbi:MAG: VWA domain-containing protein [Firmicutes bacterium]|nr:VWA domain-containing protein [Bacillota bacterium]